MGKKILKFLLLFIAVCVLSAGISALPIAQGKNLHKGLGDNNAESGIVDDVNLLDSSEFDEMEELIKDTAEKTDLNVLVILGDMHLGEEGAEEHSYEKYCDIFGEYTDGVLLYLDLAGKSTASDAMYFSGKAHLMYQDRLDDMFDSLYIHLPKSGQTIHSLDFMDGITTFCKDLETYEKQYKSDVFKYEMNEIDETYTYMRGDTLYITKSKAPGSRFIFMQAASLIGLVIALIVYFSVKKHYQFKTSANPSVYVSHGETNFTEKSDTYIRTYTTRHRIQSSSGGSRGGGGGVRSGGGGSRSR
ncbi:MAG: hypothetical protein IJ487_03225 [Ruminococcus sp.]|nr:hypothetical protein [Ruminococcus sp.]